MSPLLFWSFLWIVGDLPGAVEKPLTFPIDKVEGTYGVVSTLDLPLWPFISDTYTQTVQLRAPSRLRFHVRAPGVDESWRLAVSVEERVLWSAAAAEGAEEYVWSAVLPSGAATIVLHDPRRTVQISLDRISERGARNVPSTISHEPPQMYPILRQPHVIQARGRAVALLEVEKEQGPLPCSGFLVSDDLLVTAAHCVASEEERRSTRVVFDYDGQMPRQLALLQRIEYTSPELDVSICRLTAKVAARPTLRVEDRALKLRDPLVLIHHADGDPKQVSGMDCRVFDVAVMGGAAAKTDLAHTCDTTGGSSGAPVFDSTGVVIAVHHLGWDEDRRILVNRAVRMGEIFEGIRGAKKTALLAELIRR